MNKNLLLIGIAVVSIVIIVILVGFNPSTEKNIYSTVKKNSLKEKNEIAIKSKGQQIKEIIHNSLSSQQPSHSKKNKNKKIRIVTTSAQNRYVIELIAKNYTNKEILHSKKKRIEGKINGVRYVLEVPMVLVNRSPKLKIVDTKTKKITYINADILQNLENTSANEILLMNIDLNNPDNISLSSYEKVNILPTGPGS
ncbi:hypothetical protein [Nitratiruptor sp. YY09-18]|uniref:hypothetical protein n=1 Tax=Nitratiruptor sp. YY09-18 TaxID=2724901 RepID=UPI0018EAEDFB|nr:hypothetical protein [Nitratiruptor sp. YY09-18]BCD68957.1 hypothetical protein NitYY0918_P24 [Nitratiruptor sp. YY09-18]